MRTLRNTLLPLLAVGILITAGVGTATQASAATSTPSPPSQATLDALEKAVFSSPDPASAFKHLTPTQQDIVRQAETPSGKGTSTVSVVGVGANRGKTFAASPNTEGCWDWDGTWTTTALLGNWITKSFETLEVCYHVSVVQSVTLKNVRGDGAWGWALTSHTEGTKNWIIRGEGVSWQTWTAGDDHSSICPLMWGDAGSANIQNNCTL
ncbi:hypothetical protein KGQ20_02235 [Catenulispora sp. NF23]|uniref:Secreted protein n=1 Tax=Catenulispora pinistramenti TaxID=2705254 RepID=A0ABS5KIF6_9ACTN|nr:hypothetical protein [Catenulispora pinistramenti]MBS2531584.1 hypothetical protein [Catenulispora pinistramenti]MBS2546166.1 hypothetical protein [Catenulispora pinistramenti]